VRQALPEVLINQSPGPKPQNKPNEATVALSPAEGPTVCPLCGGKVTKNGTYWVLNWVLMLMMGWLGVQKVLIQRRRCKECGHKLPRRNGYAKPKRVGPGGIKSTFWWA